MLSVWIPANLSSYSICIAICNHEHLWNKDTLTLLWILVRYHLLVMSSTYDSSLSVCDCIFKTLRQSSMIYSSLMPRFLSIIYFNLHTVLYFYVQTYNMMVSQTGVDSQFDSIVP